MAYFVAGGSTAACPHPGVTQTDLFTVNQNGELCCLTVQAAGTWSSPLPLTAQQFAAPGSFVAVSPDYGADVPGVDVFLVDNTGALKLFTQATPGSSWRNVTLGQSGQFAGGAQTFVVLPGTLLQTDIVNQINVLICDQAGTLQCFHRDASQEWSVEPVFQLGLKAANANLAGLFRVSNSQRVQDRRFFFVDSTGVLNCGTDTGNGWQMSTIALGGSTLIPSTMLAASARFGTATAASDDLDDANVFAVDSQGRLVCYAFGSSGVWQWTPITNLSPAGGYFAPPGAPVAACREYFKGVGSPYQTDVFVVGNDQGLYVCFSQNGAPWDAPVQILANVGNVNSSIAVTHQAGAPSAGAPPQTDLFLCDLNQHLSVFYIFENSRWLREVLPDGFDPNVPLLQGGEQVVFSTGAAFLSNLQVDILITEDLVPALQIDAWGNPVGGLSLQLNCDGATADNSYWEQFTFSLDPYSFFAPSGTPSLTAAVECWQRAGGFIDVETFQFLLDLPSTATPRIPAGYRLRIELTASAPGNAVIEAKFFVFDPSGSQTGYWDAQLLTMQLRGPNGVDTGVVPISALSRLVSFQLNIVGFDAGQRTQLLSGAGTISYTSTIPLTPALIAHTNTAEDSNCIYSTVPTTSSNTFQQRFQVLP
jgi:hypothetical protein